MVSDAVRAEMLPLETSVVVPTLLNASPEADVIALSLRDALYLFETQYLHPQLPPVVCNISRRAVRRHGMQAPHRKLK